METTFLINKVIFSLSLLGILLVFLFNPLFVWLLSFFLKKTELKKSNQKLSVSVLTIVHNGQHLIREKIMNSLSLTYPADDFQIVVFSDGSDDATEEYVKGYTDRRVHLVSSTGHAGKNLSINKAVQHCHGDLLVFSDADAVLDKAAIMQLAAVFADPQVGGACGQRIISQDQASLKKAQSDYIRFDSRIKLLENRIGSISANDGKLFAIRRELFMPLPASATDDLFLGLAVVRQHRRLVFVPEARAYIRVPSRSALHEIQRRRRIVARSLNCILHSREVLNPFRFGFFSIRLAINKLGRRLLPIFLVFLFVSSLFLSFYHPFYSLIFIGQACFYFLALAFHFSRAGQNSEKKSPIARIASTIYYFCVGNYGTFLGLLDYMRGSRPVKWQPQKTS